MSKRAIVFVAWGKTHLDELQTCLQKSKGLEKYDKILITETETKKDIVLKGLDQVIYVDFSQKGNTRKITMYKHVPKGYDSYLFLDTDTIVLEDVSYGFEKAEQYGLAMVIAPIYSLQILNNYSEIMQKEGITPKGQSNYNSGVLFFSLTDEIINLFERWERLAKEYKCTSDQKILTVAMEQAEFNPFVLNSSFNYRTWNEPASGIIRIWHNHNTLPKSDINAPDKISNYRLITNEHKVARENAGSK